MKSGRCACAPGLAGAPIVSGFLHELEALLSFFAGNTFPSLKFGFRTVELGGDGVAVPSQPGLLSVQRFESPMYYLFGAPECAVQESFFNEIFVFGFERNGHHLT